MSVKVTSELSSYDEPANTNVLVHSSESEPKKL